MKNSIALFVCAYVLGILTISVFAETPPRPYRSGTVWVVASIRIKPGHEMEYKEHLATKWKAIQEDQKKQGLILSYRVFVSDATYGANDWNVLLMKEYKNLAAFEASEHTREEIELKQFGGEKKYREGYDDRESGREILDQKVTRELVLESSK